jgi:hypothetical protein
MSSGGIENIWNQADAGVIEREIGEPLFAIFGWLS